MLEEERINPKHGAIRQLLRVVGPVLAGLGLLLIAIGFGSLFSGFSSFGGGDPFGPPRHFWCVFAGMPLLFVGVVMSMFGFMGAVARYQAGEVAPVGKDTFNYLAEETQGGVKTVATAISAGLAEGRASTEKTTPCPKCHHLNDGEAKFCDECGAPMSRICPSCKKANDYGAKFCNNCGSGLTE